MKGEIGLPGFSVEGQKGAKGDSYFKDFGDFTRKPFSFYHIFYDMLLNLGIETKI